VKEGYFFFSPVSSYFLAPVMSPSPELGKGTYKLDLELCYLLLINRKCLLSLISTVCEQMLDGVCAEPI
jgi:hypothetical protein